MRRNAAVRPGPRGWAGHQEPLEERVDKAGKLQREDPAKARLSREHGRRSEEDERGWWWHDGDGTWDFYGDEDPPE